MTRAVLLMIVLSAARSGLDTWRLTGRARRRLRLLDLAVPDEPSPHDRVHRAAGAWRRAETAVGRAIRRAAGRVVDDALDARVGRAVIAGATGLAIGAGPALAAAAGLVVWAVPVGVAARRRARRRRRIGDDAPEVIELVRLGVGSGLNVRLALEAVTRHHAGPIAVEVRRVVDRAERGERLADALESSALDHPSLRPLVDALVATERDGAPLVDALDRVAADARTAARRRAEEAARRVPVKLLFPLVFCTLPAFILLTVVPVLLRSLPSFAP